MKLQALRIYCQYFRIDDSLLLLVDWYDLYGKKLKASKHKLKFKSASSNPWVVSSNPGVTSSNPGIYSKEN